MASFSNLAPLAPERQQPNGYVERLPHSTLRLQPAQCCANVLILKREAVESKPWIITLRPAADPRDEGLSPLSIALASCRVLTRPHELGHSVLLQCLEEAVAHLALLGHNLDKRGVNQRQNQGKHALVRDVAYRCSQLRSEVTRDHAEPAEGSLLSARYQTIAPVNGR